jgi:hypothetical protein
VKADRGERKEERGKRKEKRYDRDFTSYQPKGYKGLKVTVRKWAAG